MSLISSDFKFNNMGRIGNDITDNTQRNLQNTRYSSYSISSYFSDKISNSQVDFVSTQPTMNVYATALGEGIGANEIDMDSQLLIKTTQERPLDKLQLFQRQFITVPYLGRGSCDPSLEMQLLQGEVVSKSYRSHFVETRWDEIKEEVRLVNPKFAEVIDELIN